MIGGYESELRSVNSGVPHIGPSSVCPLFFSFFFFFLSFSSFFIFFFMKPPSVTVSFFINDSGQSLSVQEQRLYCMLMTLKSGEG